MLSEVKQKEWREGVKANTLDVDEKFTTPTKKSKQKEEETPYFPPTHMVAEIPDSEPTLEKYCPYQKNDKYKHT